MLPGILYCLVFLPTLILASNQEVLSNIRAELMRISSKTNHLEETLVEKSKQIDILSERLADKDREISALRLQVQSFNKVNRRQLGFVSESEVGFSARVSRHMTNLAADQPIVFGKTLTNIGHYYNNTTGVFYTPVSGTYMFFVNILSEANSFIETELLVNGNVLAELYSGGERYNGAGSNLVIAHLAKGDNVWVKVHGIYGSSNMAVHCCWSTFSGYLLREGDGTEQGQFVG